jgi:hypothetical protein
MIDRAKALSFGISFSIMEGRNIVLNLTWGKDLEYV